MIRVARYSPNENDGDIKVWRVVRRATRWRIEIAVHLEGREPEARVIRLEDPMRLDEVTDIAISAIEELTPNNLPVVSAWMDFWADV